MALFLCALSIGGCRSLQTIQEERRTGLARAVEQRVAPFPTAAGARLDSISVDPERKSVVLYLNREFSHDPFRPESVDRLYRSVRQHFADAYPDHTYSIRTLGVPVEELIPNYYRMTPQAIDTRRMPPPSSAKPGAVVRDLDGPPPPVAGLADRTVVLWHSHGWYFNNLENRWEWQRPRLFQTVEDRVPMSFTLPYLVPMLERAGATVFLPRERDTQVNECIVDNDDAGRNYVESTSGIRRWRQEPQGFAVGMPPYPANLNPFSQGTSRSIETDSAASATATWIPEIPETGEYDVTVAYAAGPANVPDAKYTVFHTGGRTTFAVDQRFGGGTWIRLGRFTFRQGYHPETGRVVLSNAAGAPSGRISADAVRFGGGVGVVARGGHASGRPKYLEGARYYLQFAGMPDTLVYDLNRGMNDYKDDYQSRGEFVNYVAGAPNGPNRNRQTPGLGIPVDVSLAFHTDAGITRNDTTVGTLSIYSLEGTDTLRVFPDSMSRFANRDLADLVQTQIVGDLRARWDPAWNRRQLRNADYSEAVRPNVPAVLLELLSHQNFLDMQFMLDPRFRFDAARAIYKAILRFVATQHGTPYVVQPLPPDHLAAEFSGARSVTLRWRPQQDPLEPGTRPDRYVVYVRRGEDGFDNGTLCNDTLWTTHELRPGEVTGFAVAALNAGGESFPSEVLSVCWLDNASAPALVINGFDRVCGPARVAQSGFAGFLDQADGGVADRKDFSFVGSQFDFDPESQFRTNDAPGHGASAAEFETRLRAGNTFDYPAVHGAALAACGVPFVSCSDEAVSDGMVSPTRYRVVDLILGREKATPWPRAAMDSLRGIPFEAFPAPLRDSLSAFARAGGSLFVSGSHVGSDLTTTLRKDSTASPFARGVLHATWVTDHASSGGRVFATDTSFLPYGTEVRFNTGFDERIYAAGPPDAIGPADGSKTLMRYSENSFSAMIGYRGAHRVVVAGFPFETLLESRDRVRLMEAVLRFFSRP
jgi:hypothetical protein